MSSETAEIPPARMKITTVIGTRPQYIKAAPVSRALLAHGHIDETIIDTGQHFDFEMSEVFIQQLGVPRPAINFGVHSKTHAQMTGEILIKAEAILQEQRPDAVLIYGDTNSTLAAALAAVKLGIPIAHVEGGIRLAIKNPEEINRRLVDHVSSLIFCPTRRAVQALAEENIRNGVHFVGDTMLDATRMVAELFKSHPHDFHDMSGAYAPYVLMTIHRAENTNDKRHFENILTYVQKEAGGQNIVFPAHPRTVQFCCNNNISLDPFRVIKPIGYFDMYSLLRGASAVFTDSGGLQKEAFFHRVPCTLIYDESPWPETIAAGWNRLWTSVEYLPRKDCDEFGDGRASSRIAHILYSYLANNSREVD